MQLISFIHIFGKHSQTESIMLTSSAIHMFLFTFTRASGSATPISCYGLAHMFLGRGWLVGAGFCKHSHAGVPIKAHGSALLSSISDSFLCEFTWTNLSHPPTQCDSFFFLSLSIKTSVNFGRGRCLVPSYDNIQDWKNAPGWKSELVTCKRQGKYLLTPMVPFQLGMFTSKQSESGNTKNNKQFLIILLIQFRLMSK